MSTLYQRNINEQNNVDTTLTANVETTLACYLGGVVYSGSLLAGSQ